MYIYISLGGSHVNGAVEESQPSQQPTSVTQLASHMSVDGCVSNHVEIVVTDTASASKKNSLEEEETTSVSEVLQHPSNYVFQLHYNYIRLHLIFLSHFICTCMYYFRYM